MSADPKSDHPLKRLLQKITGQDAEATAIRESLEEVIEESERESPPCRRRSG